MGKMNNIRRGDISELIACTWLLEKGHEVFRNVSSTGPIDIIAVKEGTVRLIDVKSINGKLNKTTDKYTFRESNVKKKQKDAGIQYLFVTDEGDCGFSTRVLTNQKNLREGKMSDKIKSYGNHRVNHLKVCRRIHDTLNLVVRP